MIKIFNNPTTNSLTFSVLLQMVSRNVPVARVYLDSNHGPSANLAVLG